ncbi:hypothetical protein PV04_09950 [Phialophora macrospora]|uniref:Zn(2)-C6 fungal-type domain-containing protein n=1 Tax=Phialophora macrospora TaxID=1851006 RepID=A0A0D2DL25_9EURO|nr:hypothetical protein PV04_09950 [Phialophora macrospora]
MSGFYALTHKFRANLDSQQAGADPKLRRRNRQPLSCGPCRLKKLKCDRGHPCETCVKRGNEAQCTYGKVSSAKALDAAAKSAKRGRAQERLGRLEQLVMQMVDTSNGAHPSHESDDGAGDRDSTPVSTGIANDGHLQYGSVESRYVGSTHWSAILENIQELKSALGDGGDQPPSTELDEPEDVEADSLFGPTNHLSIAQILAQALPPRLQVDRRLSTYFNSRYLIIPFIHTQQFQRQYEQFWRTPLDTPPLWISILFSICCMSAGLSEAVGSEPTTPEDQLSPRMTFLHAAGQCLRLGGFTRPKRYVVEALGLYAQSKYTSSLNPAGDVGIIFSIAVRLAYRSGYHRDPSQFPHISVFEGEMRRRTWAMCRQFDLMVSFQLGLPSQIPPNSWDTMNPRNVLDTDFDEDTKVAPPPRPETEATQILYFVVKSRLMTTFGKVCAHALSFRTGGYPQQVMDLDREVRATYATVPSVLHIKPMSQSFADPSYLTMVRTNCEFLYQKSLLVLHRKYMTQGTHPASTRACTDAAIAIIRHMLDLHKEFKPGGQLFNDRWMLNAFTLNDFYLAGMVLCLGVSIWKKANPGTDINADEQMKEQYTKLGDSLAICEELSPTSSEARRVAAVLRAVLWEKGDETASSSAGGTFSSSSTGPSPDTQPSPFRQPGKFMPSAMFPMQYDFNLAPLTLQDEPQQGQRQGEGHLRESLSSSSDAGDPTSYFAPPAGNVSGGMTPLNTFQNLMPGIDNPVNLGENPFFSFFPFSPSYGAGPASNQLPGASASDPANPQTFVSPTTMDIDWPLLDQWMALPDPIDILPFQDPATGGSIQASSSGPFQDQQHQHRDQGHVQVNEPQEDVENGDPNPRTAYPPLTDAQAMTQPDTEWTSTPYPFLGNEAGTTTAPSALARDNGGAGGRRPPGSVPGSILSEGDMRGGETGMRGPRPLTVSLDLRRGGSGYGASQRDAHYPTY